MRRWIPSIPIPIPTPHGPHCQKGSAGAGGKAAALELIFTQIGPVPKITEQGLQLVKKEFDKLVDGGASSPATATPTSFC